MASNSSILLDLPPLPSYILTPRVPVLAPIPDNILSLILPVVAYWVVSMIFHFIDVNDLFSQYRLHTPAELLKRNHVSRIDVVRDVILQHIIQTIAGLGLSFFDEKEFVGREEYDVAVWARRIRIMQRVIPTVLGFIGIDAIGLSKSLSAYPALSGFLAGGVYPDLVQKLVLDNGNVSMAPAHATWELVVAHFIYSYFIPGLQFFFAIGILDTWQYFWHRAMHLNRWLYVNFHSRHHRLYVPYAFGALYNHPVEGFLLDTAGTGVAFLLTQMTHRQAMWFFTFSTIKTVDDHCGYHFPWDPLQLITSNNAAYHDIHHQSWGIKTNFSQPFFIFWDRFMGTRWQGDVTLKYERARTAAEKQVERERSENNGQPVKTVLESEPGPLDAGMEDVPVQERAPRKILPRTTRSASKRIHGVNGSIRQK
ncbi:putative sphinganine hydroxylase Sur2 [Talaromyces proteolyticus]|uniref:Sphinganine hydroxylase Sur2 n=1 Tax=Talaromyces proteolyticus TaxID=1131652 RepID=A0AAD4PXC1_9EURO|nr:putative sphinganine hydroxylase Sur2 [Talaromyces proteolyticus]KAH8699177.1 putative sphinganine hydroxylase Sur2 [Talaromyces proteolyticus]